MTDQAGMDQLKRLYAQLSLRQRITVAAAAAAVVSMLTVLARWNSERDFRPLYGNLSGEDAAAVVNRLRESGVEYRLADNGSTVKVPSAKVDEQRIQLAAAGLPKSGRIGFELFDRNNFGTSEFAEQVNFQRALEGELERSIMSLSEVERARVHITASRQSVFLERRQPAKASVLVKLRPGARLSGQNTLAICHLAASAVEGLSPEAVSVLDMNGNLLNRPRPAGEEAEASAEALEYRQRVEKDLLAKIQNTLEPVLGPDRFRAGVSLEVDMSRGEESEELYDPARSVMLSAQKSEDAVGAGSSSGVPGTASSLPRPTSRPGASGSGLTRRTENLTFQTSRTVRRVEVPRGTIKRMSVSLLVDHDMRWEGAGGKLKKVVSPPSAEKLKSIRELVAGVVGLQQNRGDQLIVEALPFETTLTSEPPAAGDAPVAPPKLQLPAWVPAWLRPRLEKELEQLLAAPSLPVIVAGAVLFTLALAMLMIRMAIRRIFRRAKSSEVRMPRELPPASEGGSLSQGRAPAEAGGAPSPRIKDPAADFSRRLEDQLAEQLSLREQQAEQELQALKLAPLATKRAEVLTRHIVDETKKDPVATAQLVRSWLSENER